MPNPLVAQGSLNRLRASLTWPLFPSLNVTSGFLGKGGIKLSLQGQATKYLETMTGAVTSQEPYQLIEAEVNLNKAQALANLYKLQMETNALLGDCTVRSDSVALSVYQLSNCSIQGVRPLDFSGEHAEYVVLIGGYYQINSQLYN